MEAVFPDLTTWWLFAATIVVAQIVYATVGFGAGMLTLAVMAHFVHDVTGVISVLLVHTFLSEVMILARSWRQVRWRMIVALLLPMALGVWLGALGLSHLSEADVAGLKRGLGLVVALAGLWFLWSEARRGAVATSPAEAPGLPRPGAALLCGLASGLLGGLFGTGGPPVIVFLKTCRLDKHGFRATIIAYFFLMSVARGGSYVQQGLLQSEHALAALVLLPAAVSGTLIGMTTHDRVPEQLFARVVSVVLMLLGLLLVVRA